MVELQAVPFDVLMSSPIMRCVAPGQERIIVWKDCPNCDGKGVLTFDDWRTLTFTDTTPPMRVNFGHARFCPRCKFGKILSHWYTRGVGLVPLIARRRATP